MLVSRCLRSSLLLPSLLSAALFLGACGGDSGPEDSLAGLKREVLGEVGVSLVARLDRFGTEVATLESATAAWATAPSDDTARTSAQQAWVAAMDTWQELEPVQFGPAGAPRLANTGTLGGQDLRNRIYSWPDVGPCRIDQATADESYAGSTFFADAPATDRGLDALEYLLFVPTSDNQCIPQAAINAEGTWAALGDETIQARRAAFAAALATDLAATTQTLRAAWGPTGHPQEIATAGIGSTVFPSAQVALSDLSAVLLYLESETQDMKLGDPTGLRMATNQACESPPCPELVESRWAGRSADHIRANLRGFRAAFEGEEGRRGVGALLTEVGAGDTRNAIVTDLDAANAALGELGETTLAEALTSDPETVQDGYEPLVRVLDAYRSTYVTALDVRLPAPPPTDND